jgi:unsaturated rhamnogalacturonyl hydrolase
MKDLFRGDLMITGFFGTRLVAWLMVSSLAFTSLAVAQETQQPSAKATAAAAATPSPVDRNAVGDAPDDPGPLAHLSPALRPADIHAAMKKVGDWQLRVAEPKFNSQWTFAALYDGLLAASATTKDSRYRDAVLKFAEQQHWKLLNDRFPHADDMALGQAYLDLYLADSPAHRRPERIADTKAILDKLIVRTDDPSKDLWWWCDALFMAPPVLARMYVATGDRKYLDYMDKEWDITTGHLFDPTEHFYFRDSRFFTQKQDNGRKLFWARGNGWVMGALVKILEVLPANDPARPRYEQKLREMAAATAAIQGSDGLWRSGLLDAESYDLPEISGSAFFTYAIAYGINQHILDRKQYLPVVEKAWGGMLTHVYADGRLGSIQPIDGQPGKFKPSASYVYGVGGFLLAGSEVDRLAGAKQ